MSMIRIGRFFFSSRLENEAFRKAKAKSEWQLMKGYVDDNLGIVASTQEAWLWQSK